MTTTHVVRMLALMQVLALSPPQSAGDVARSRPLFAQLHGRALELRGPRDRRTVTFAIPTLARSQPATLELGFTYQGLMLPTANLQLFVNGHRRSLVARADADREGRVHTRIALARTDMAAGAVQLTIEARLVAGADRCEETSSTSARVLVDSTSSVVLHYSADGDPRELAVEMLPAEVVFSLGEHALTPDQIGATLRAAARLARDGHTIRFVRLPGQSEPVVATGGVVPDDVLRSVPLQPAPRAVNPSITELGASSLASEFDDRGEWRIPVDVRTLPAGRVPERAILKLVVAPNQGDPHVSAKVLMNDRVLRDVDLRGDGSRRTIRVILPLDELRIYNEVRIVVVRPAASFTNCTEEETSTPSQLQEDSYLVLGAAPPRPRTFGEFVAILPEQFDLYVPEAFAPNAATLLPLLLSADLALWGPVRDAHVRFYQGARPATLTGPSVIMRSGATTTTTLQVGSADRTPVLWISPSAHNAYVPSAPELFGTSDSLSFDGPGGRAAAVPHPVTRDAPTTALGVVTSNHVFIGFGMLVLISVSFATYARLRRGTGAK